MQVVLRSYFQNHCTHETTILELSTGLQLHGYSFQGLRINVLNLQLLDPKSPFSGQNQVQIRCAGKGSDGVQPGGVGLAGTAL